MNRHSFTFGTTLLIACIIASIATLLVVTDILDPAGVTAVFMFLTLVAAMASSGRRRDTAYLLGYLDHIVRLELPMPESLAAASRGESSRQLGRLSDALADGFDLADALREHAPDLDARRLGIIAAGERVGRLGQTLERLVAEQRRRETDAARQTAHSWVYPAIIVALIVPLAAVVARMGLPHVSWQMEEMGVTPPTITTALIEASRGSGIVVPIAVFITCFICATCFLSFNGRPADDIGAPVPAVLDRLLGWVPAIGGMIRNRDLADSLSLIASASSSGVPLPSAINEASQLRIGPRTRAALLRWQDRIEHGEEVGPAARAAGLPPIVAALLSTSPGPSGMNHALDFLARYYEGRFSRAAVALSAVATPAAVVIVALGVAAIALAVFMPLAALIDQFSVPPGVGG